MFVFVAAEATAGDAAEERAGVIGPDLRALACFLLISPDNPELASPSPPSPPATAAAAAVGSGVPVDAAAISTARSVSLAAFWWTFAAAASARNPEPFDKEAGTWVE